ncbi:uncharacterized protein LOC119589457 [Penaeus monodon]|uniref:uncharacterized protein LOC119589457 n=1 Tax=Penaeus monodon TaxID=6687 RepID=UPI0018A6E6CA|nr:uncharacterized protein LOC119589457 [Penaeus monodon]
MKIVIATIIFGVVMGTACAFSTQGKPWSVVQADMAKDWRRGARIPYHGSNEHESGESYEHDSNDNSNESHGPYNEKTYTYHSGESAESDGYYNNKRGGHDENYGYPPHP